MKLKTVTTGLVALGIVGQIAAETKKPDQLWAVVETVTSLQGRGGTAIYECNEGIFPWNGGCRYEYTGGGGQQCGDWTLEMTSVYRGVHCDGTLHFFPTKTYWLRQDNTFYNVGFVKPQLQMPPLCLTDPYIVTNHLVVNNPTCPFPHCWNWPGSWWCACRDTGHGYTPDPRCCDAQFTMCSTCWDPIGGLQYCCCCRYDPQWGWLCQ